MLGVVVRVMLALLIATAPIALAAAADCAGIEATHLPNHGATCAIITDVTSRFSALFVCMSALGFIGMLLLAADPFGSGSISRPDAYNARLR